MYAVVHPVFNHQVIRPWLDFATHLLEAHFLNIHLHRSLNFVIKMLDRRPSTRALHCSPSNIPADYLCLHKDGILE
jgi:hypothetical protein